MSISTENLRIDHVIVAVPNLVEYAGRFLREYGLASVEGGEHPEIGTANRVIPVGDSYVELLAIRNHNIAVQNEIGRYVMAQVADGHQILGWAVATDDIEAVASRLGLEIELLHRTLPDGTDLVRRMCGVNRLLEGSSLPGFIDCPQGMHPSDTPIEHPSGARRISRIDVGGTADDLTAWLGGADVPVRAEGGPPGAHLVVIETNAAEIVLQ